MTVWIDPPVWPAHGRLFSHVVSDASYAELHEVAQRAGVPRRAFDGDHYDVAADRHSDLVRAGAFPTSGADLVRRLNASGLRLRKRKGDRGLARLFDQRTPFGTATLDIVAGDRPVAHPDAVAMLAPDPCPWGVPWAASGTAAAAELLRTASPVGWLRIGARDGVRVVQVVAEPRGDQAVRLPHPWSLLQEHLDAPSH